MSAPSAPPRPEFSRTVKLNDLGAGAQNHVLSADAEERAALAARFGLLALDRLEASLALSREGQRVRMTGQLSADVTQACIASGAPVPATLTETLNLLFVPEEDLESTEEEIELSQEDCDTLAHDGRVVDMGEAAAQSLALALNPYPRAKGAEAALKQAGVIGEEEAGPFGALAGLKAKLSGKES